MERRQFVKLITATSLTTACDGSLRNIENSSSSVLLTPTRTDSEGPYYPVKRIPDVNNLLKNTEHLGQELRLSGRVMDQSGTPVKAAKVEIWQCDGQGIYPHPAAPNNQRFDPHFTGAGTCMVNPEGAYSFTTIVPVPYTGRPPHIHTKVFVGSREKLTSQIYLSQAGGHKKLKVDLVEQQSALFAASFDFVIKL